MTVAPLFQHIASGRLGLEPPVVARELQSSFDAASAADATVARRATSVAAILANPASAVGYTAYTRAAAPIPAFGQTAVEVAPVAGVQTWALQASAAPIASLIATQVTAIEAQFAAKVAAGVAYAGEVVQIDDSNRANLTALGSTAIGVIAGSLPAWPADYARGWVAVSGNRIPLATPQAGLTLAAAAGARYAALVQHEADLIATALACTTLTALTAIDPTAGWPA